MREQRIFLTKDSITTSIDFSADVIYSSHEDGYLRTWDIRSPTTNPTETFKSHRRYASCVKKQEHWTTFASVNILLFRVHMMRLLKFGILDLFSLFKLL